MSVSALLANPLGRALDHLLELDPDARERLRPLAGRQLVLQLKGTPARIRLALDADARWSVALQRDAQTGEATPVEADLRLTASPGTILRLLASGEAGVGQLRIEGDAELARQLERLARSWTPDLDAVFTRPFGDVLGFQLARVARALGQGVRRGLQRATVQVSEYLVEESRDVVSRTELDVFLDDVDTLRDRVDGLERRLARRIAQASASP